MWRGHSCPRKSRHCAHVPLLVQGFSEGAGHVGVAPQNFAAGTAVSVGRGISRLANAPPGALSRCD